MMKDLEKVQNFICFVSGVIKEMMRRGELKISLHDTRSRKIVLESFVNC